MTLSLNNPAEQKERLDAWLGRVRDLMIQIADWSKESGWEIQEFQKTLSERLAGSYIVPFLKISRPDGQISIVPVALDVIGGEGRVDVQAIPTLSRVRLVGGPEGWTIITDSNIPIRLPWNKQTFTQLANDLLG